MILLQSIGVPQIPGLITKTYITAGIFGIIMLIVAIIISTFFIAYDDSIHAKDSKYRKLVFWTITAITPVLFYLYNIMIVMKGVRTGPAQSQFATPAAISAVVACVTVLVLGFILSKAFKESKIGNWFPSKK